MADTTIVRGCYRHYRAEPYCSNCLRLSAVRAVRREPIARAVKRKGRKLSHREWREKLVRYAQEEALARGTTTNAVLREMRAPADICV